MSSRHLTVLDTDADWTRFCIDALTREGFRVVAVDRKSLAIPFAEIDDSDLLVLCLTRVTREELTLMRGLTQHFPSLRILVFGTILMPQNVRDLFRAGACDVVDKPFNGDRLAAIVRDHIDRAKSERGTWGQANPGSRRALVVEDSPEWQRELTRTLSGCGLRVDVVCSEGEAHAMLSSNSYDVAIVDLRLSEGERWDVGGLRLLQTMRPGTAASRVPKVVVSGYTTSTYVRAAFKCSDVVDVLSKDAFDAAELCEVVARVLDRGTAVGTVSTSSVEEYG